MIILQAVLGFIALSGLFFVLYLIGRVLCAYLYDEYVLTNLEDVESKVLCYVAHGLLGALTLLVLLFIFGICMKIGQVFL